MVGAPKYLYDKSGQFIEDIRSGYTRDQPFPEGYATFGEKIGRGADVTSEKIADLTEKGYGYFSPSKREEAFLAERDYGNAKNILDKQLADGAIDETQYKVKLTQAAKRAEQEIGTIAKYGPAALGLGALAYAGGAFGEEEEAEAEMFDPYYSGTDYIRDNPQLFSRRFKSYTPYLYAKGGIAQEFPRKTGPINGPGTGTSDSIPAMLSDGEFVMTAKAVRNIGGGSRRKGAAKMYKMMKELEKRTA